MKLYSKHSLPKSQRDGSPARQVFKVAAHRIARVHFLPADRKLAHSPPCGPHRPPQFANTLYRVVASAKLNKCHRQARPGLTVLRPQPFGFLHTAEAYIEVS